MPSPTTFALNLAPTRKSRPKDSELVFGRTFTDHMALLDWETERGWFDARVVPYGPLSLDPAAAVFHYAQEQFDGLKAFRGSTARSGSFASTGTASGCTTARTGSASRRSTRR